jgi:hypothetical protein
MWTGTRRRCSRGSVPNFGSALDAPGSINNVNAYNYSAYWASSNDDPVPEPGTLGIVLVSGPLLLALGRRRRARR